jgi:nucleoid-associated protein YgaU
LLIAIKSNPNWVHYVKNYKEKEMAEEKGLFSKLFGKKDSKKELEEAARKAAEAAKKEAEVAAQNAKRVADAARYEAEAAARKAEHEARRAAEEAEAKAKEVAEANAARVEQAARYEAEAEARKAEYEARRAAEEAAAYVGEHTVTADDTLSHIALKFYGKATPPYYKLIYEANKDIIGDNMNIIVPGQVLRIPALPEELK